MALTQVSSGGIADGAVTANDLENSGVTAGTYGSSSAIPAITVDAKGRITSASTNSVTQVGGANGVDFNDSVKARFGTGNDLEIYHDGSNSYIQDAGTGSLTLATDGANIALQKGSTETLAIFKTDGACELYHDNSKKLETTSSGIDVTGSVTCDGLSVEGNVLIQSSVGIVTLQDSDSSGNAQANYIEGRDSSYTQKWYLGDINADGDLYVRNQQAGAVYFGTNSGSKVVLSNSGHFLPVDNNTYNLGSPTERWSNVYTNDLNLSNEGGTNDVDGTWGSWTIQEGEDDLFLLNRRNGKKYKFNLSEVN